MILAVTGANGFLGRELVSHARMAGVEVYELVRSGGSDSHIIEWQLGKELPAACLRADCVIHLASATLGATSGLDAAAELDALGTRILLDSVRQIRLNRHPVRFVFVSSQSASPDASNAYGRSKWTIEHMLDQTDEIVVRPGLVYGNQSNSVAGLLEKLTRLPIVPVVQTVPSIQPIDVAELAKCLLRVAVGDVAGKLFKLGAMQPLTLRQAIVATAKRAGRRAPLMLTLPLPLVRLCAWLVDWSRAMKPSLSERIEGLVALRPMDTENSLRSLGVLLLPFDETKDRLTQSSN